MKICQVVAKLFQADGQPWWS